MAEKVEVDIEINSNIEPTIANLKALKRQLKETAAGSADFNKLSAQIRDMDDAIKDASATSDDFAGYLENASGPLGILGKGLRSAEKNFSSFNAVLKASVIGLVVAAIGGLVAAFSQSETAMKKMQPIFIAFEKILGGIFKAFEPVLDIFIEFALEVLPSITKGIGIFYSSLFGLVKFIKEAVVGAGKILKGVFTLDFDSIKEGAEQLKNSISTSVDAGMSAYKRFEEGSNELTKTEKLNAEERQKLLDEAQKKREEAAAKAQKLREEQQKLNDAANAVELEAFKSSLDERAKAEYEAGILLEQQRATLAAAGRTDATAIEEQYRSTLADIKKKYDDEQAKIQEAIDAKAKADLLKQLSEERELILIGLESKFEALDRENQRLDDDFDADLERYAEQRVILAEQEATELSNVELTELEKTQIRKKYADIRNGISAAETATERSSFEAKRAIMLQYVDLVGQLGSLLQSAAGKNKALAIAGLLIEQAAGVARIVINTQAAAAKAGYLTPVGIATLIAGALSVTSAIIATKKGINQINAQNIPGGGGGGSGGGGMSASSIAMPSLPRVGGMASPQIQTGGGESSSSQIAQTIAMAQSKPQRAYVVSGEVSSQQALDRRVTRAATFSGG